MEKTDKKFLITNLAVIAAIVLGAMFYEGIAHAATVFVFVLGLVGVYFMAK
jgi:hypothetical protein